MELTLGGGYARSELTKEDAIPVSVEIAVRRGLSDRLDLGIAPFMGLGLLADVKYALLSPGNPFALSIQAGAGASCEALWALMGGGCAGAFHVPVKLLASYDLGAVATPYASVGYGGFWFYGMKEEPRPDVRYAARDGKGDGVLSLRLGVELRLAGRTALLVEAGLLEPIRDDPGDGFAFGRAATASIGFRL